MTMTTIDCRRFDELLPEYLEHELALPLRAGVDAHVAACARCAATLADVRSVIDRAGALPTLQPPRDLWAGIAARLDTPVTPIASAPAARRRQGLPRWISFAAAAAVLMAVTSLVTREWVLNGTPDSTGIAALPAEPVVESPAPASGSETASANTESVPVARSSTPRTTNVSAPVAERPTGLEVYRREIAVLESMVANRDSVLDPATVAIIENSLRIIDSAIVEAHAALARDPASRFLREQVDRSLHRKMELLRSVAVLTSRSS